MKHLGKKVCRLFPLVLINFCNIFLSFFLFILTLYPLCIDFFSVFIIVFFVLALCCLFFLPLFTSSTTLLVWVISDYYKKSKEYLSVYRIIHKCTKWKPYLRPYAQPELITMTSTCNFFPYISNFTNNRKRQSAYNNFP